MTNNIQSSISAIIQQNLPEAVGQELKTELTRLYEVERNFNEQSIQLKDVRESLEKKRKECLDLDSKCDTLTEQNNTFKDQAEAVQLAQIKINELVLQARLDAAICSNTNILNLVQTILSLLLVSEWSQKLQPDINLRQVSGLTPQPKISQK
jgi:hypothetical protein